MEVAVAASRSIALYLVTICKEYWGPDEDLAPIAVAKHPQIQRGIYPEPAGSCPFRWHSTTDLG